ncbi:MAG: hypothetical protein E3J72_13025 [Planctomycetota bacterium]|nr:MAG: hypothetical protein E3J72_13025 [Planctomycetota bacterium]
MKKPYRKPAVLILSLLLIFTGCLKMDKTENFRLNPDGSGKVKITATFGVTNFQGGGEPDLDDLMQKTLENSKGVDAWKGTEFKSLGEDNVKFTGTAYFRDISKMKLKVGESMIKIRYAVTKDKAGNTVLTAAMEDQKEPSPAKKVELSEADLKAEIKKAREEFERTKPMMAVLLPQFKYKACFHLWGEIVEVVNFTKEKDGSVSLTIDGLKMYEAVEKLTANDEWWKKQILSGKNLQQDGPDEKEMFEIMFGKAASPRVVFKPGEKAVFDYAQEVAAAKKETAALKKKLGLVEIEEVESGDPGTVTLKVVGASMKRVEDKEFYLQKEYILTMVGRLPQKALKIDKCTLKKVLTDTGKSMLPKKRWDREMRFLKLARDGRKFKFDVRLELPPADVKGFQEIAGVIEYFQSAGARKTDLGITSFAKGAKGKEFSAKIKEIKESEWEKGTMEVTVELKINLDSVKGAIFLNDKGNELENKKTGHMSFGNQTEITFSVKGPLPKSGKIILEVFDKMKKFKKPFSVKNIDLMGNPVK